MVEEKGNFQIFHIDSLSKTYMVEEKGRQFMYGLLSLKGKYFLLKNCIMHHDPYVVVVEKDIYEITEKEYLNLIQNN